MKMAFNHKSADSTVIPTNSEGGGYANQESGLPFDDSRYRQQLTKLFADWREWKLTGDEKFFNSSVAAARRIDKQSQGKTTPIGIFHSAGSGLETAPLSSIAELLKKFPEAELYGNIKLSTVTAEFSAKCYEHCRNLFLKAQSRTPNLDNPAFDNLIRHAYIPTPNLINGMPVIGPIPLNKEVSDQFLSWVKGPMLHDQLASTKGYKNLPGIISKLQHCQLWVVSQMTGVWQADPCVPNGDSPKDLEESVKAYYLKTAADSLNKYVSFAGLTVSPENLKMAGNALEKITSKLVVSADPINGNIGRYFDSALRNFISEVGDVNATAGDVVNRVFRSGSIDYYRLWDVTRRIDFSNFDRLWCIYDEDIAHITENWNVTASKEQKEQYAAAVTLTRLALLHHAAFENGQRSSLKDAVSLADDIQALRDGELKPSEISEFNEYVLKYEPNVKIMPWLRKSRQGVLALVYLGKTYAHEAESNVPANPVIRDDLCAEAQNYVSRVIDELPSVLHFAGINGKEAKGEVGALEDVLNEVLQRIGEGKLSVPHLLQTGSEYLTTLR